MAKTYITEFAQGAKQWDGPSIAAPQDNGLVADGGSTIEQTPITNSGASQQSAAFAGGTRLIRLTSDGIISYLIGTDPTVTVNHRRLPAGAIEYIGVKPGHKIAIITNT